MVNVSFTLACWLSISVPQARAWPSLGWLIYSGWHMLCLVRTTPPLLPLPPSIELHSSRLIFYRLLLKVKSIFSIRLCKIPKLAFYKVMVRQTAARLTETLFIALHGGRSWVTRPIPCCGFSEPPPTLLLAIKSVLLSIHCATGTAILEHP